MESLLVIVVSALARELPVGASAYEAGRLVAYAFAVVLVAAGVRELVRGRRGRDL